MLASEGYPGEVKKGDRISGIDTAEGVKNVAVFHAATEKKNGELLTSGGRVLNVVATGHGLFQALSKAYQGVNKIYFRGMQYRKDIASRALNAGRPN